MLLFQYGNYKYDNEVYFSLDITRQFSKKNFDMFQISLTLLFDPADFKELESYNSWGYEFKDVNEWIQNLRNTKGYQLAEPKTSKLYKLTFDKV